MKEFRIYSDLHKGHIYEIKPEIKFSKNTVFLGDNFDIGNVSRKNLDGLKKLRLETIRKIKSVGGIYISGNHSLTTHHSATRDGILFLHGDIIHYGEKNSKLRRSKKPGKGSFYRAALWTWKKIKSGEHNNIRNKYLEKAKDLAMKNKCHTICLGHFHPRKLIDISYKGIRIIIVPRGMTKIKI